MDKRANRNRKTAGRRGHLRVARALVLSVALAVALAVAYFDDLSKLKAAGGDHPALWIAVAIGVWVAFAWPVQVRNRLVSVSIGLAEIPALVGIVFLAPGLALLAVLAGYVAASVQRREQPVKAASNVLLYLASVSVATVLYDLIIGTSSPVGARGMAAGLVAVTAVTVLDLGLLLGFVVAVDDHWRGLQFRSLIIHAWIGFVTCVLSGLIAVCLVWVNTWGAVLFVAIALTADLTFRAAMQSRLRYAHLRRLYAFTHEIGVLLDSSEVIAAALEEARTLLAVDRSEILLQHTTGATSEPTAVRHILVGDEPAYVEHGVPVANLDVSALEHGPLLPGKAQGRQAPLMAGLAQRGIKEALIAPLRSDDPASGYMLVADRAFNHEGFSASDLHFFEALASNAGAALRSNRLLDKLRQQVEDRKYEAQHDSLTGLANRELFAERLASALTGATPTSRVAVMLIDLDGFKEINDTLGHQTGDAILVGVAKRLAAIGHGPDIVARLGGDEFAVMLTELPGSEAVNAKAQEVLRSITEPLAVDNMLLDIRASLGSALCPPDSPDPDDLVRHADIAMYSAKRFKSGTRLYDEEEDRSTLRRLGLATELRRAIEENGLELWYQPMVDLSTGATVGCEALLRWHHAQYGPISSAELIPVAESAGLVDKLTRWALETSLAQAKLWRELVPDLRMAINVTARSIKRADFLLTLDEVLAGASLEPSALSLEIAEPSAMADPKGSERALWKLRHFGVKLAIDNYGAGFSSLGRLKRLPFDELKIDRSFIKELVHSTSDEAVVRSTIELTRNLGRTVTALGVEDAATLKRLEHLGCHTGQGYFLAPPVPARQCEEWLAATKEASAFGAPKPRGYRLLAQPVPLDNAAERS